MTHGTWPGAVSFDPEGGATRIWEDTLATPGQRVRVLLVISGEAARYSGWSGRAVIALADALARRHPVLLADLHFEQPELDALAGGRDAEGIADAILYGASLDRISRALDEHGFEVIPTGGPVADPEAVYRSTEWPRLVEEAARRDATLVLYAPWRARGMEGLVGVVDMAVMLGGNTDTRLAQGYLPHDIPVQVVLSPGTPRPAQAAAAASDPVAAAPAKPAVRTARSPFRWIVPLLLLAAAAAAVAFVLFERESRQQAPLPAPPPAPTAPVAGEPAGQSLPFAVAIEAHRDLVTASARVASLRALEPAAGFFLAPILVDSVIYYRVMAGPVADSLDAAALMDSLIANGHKTGGSEWDIRNVPLAFELGVFDGAEAAQARVSELAGRQIPAYVLEVPYTGGGARYHVYCGAWAGPAEADVMRQVLADAAIPATLVPRIGRSTT